MKSGLWIIRSWISGNVCYLCDEWNVIKATLWREVLRLKSMNYGMSGWSIMVSDALARMA